MSSDILNILILKLLVKFDVYCSQTILAMTMKINVTNEKKI
jgi:hypothetical protein